MASYLPFISLFLLKLLLKLYFFCYAFLFMFYTFFYYFWWLSKGRRITHKGTATLKHLHDMRKRGEEWKGGGVLLLLHLARQPYEPIVFTFGAARSPSGHSWGAGQTSVFSFQSSKPNFLKTESINARRMNWATTHGTRSADLPVSRNMTSRTGIDKLYGSAGGESRNTTPLPHPTTQ